MVLHEEQGPGDTVVDFVLKAVVAGRERNGDDLGRIDAAALDSFLESGIGLDDRADELKFLIQNGDLAVFWRNVVHRYDGRSANVDDDILGSAVGQIDEDDTGPAPDRVTRPESQDLVLVGLFKSGVDEPRRVFEQTGTGDDGAQGFHLLDGEVAQWVVDSGRGFAFGYMCGHVLSLFR